MIIRTSFHTIVRAEPLTLPRGGGDRDSEIEFWVTFDASLSSPDERPYLLYRVNLQGDEPVHLVLRINGDEIVDQVIRDTNMLSFHKVIDADVVRIGDNTLVVRVPDDQQGTIVLSDVILVHSARYLIPTTEDDPGSTGGPL